MLGEGKKYTVEIPDFESADLGVDFDALLVELRSLKRRLKTEKQEIGIGNPRGALKKEEVRTSIKQLIRSQHRSETIGDDVLEEMTLNKARELVRLVARKVNARVDTGHEVQFFDQVNDLVDIVSDKIVSTNGYPKEPDYAGFYHPDTDEIEMKKENFDLAQDPFSVIAYLTNTGADINLQTIKHELTHRKQKESNKKATSDVYQGLVAISFIGGVLSYSITSGEGKKKSDWQHTSILKESQAHIVANKKRRFKNLHDVFAISEAYGDRIREQGDWDRLIMAYQQIKELYALGISEEEITALVANAVWNKESISYTNFDKKIELEKVKRGLDKEDVENLVLAEDLRERIKALKVSLIACEELIKMRDNRN
ncbi:MAG TPA: hypothetical protein DEB09_03120 [Candidatus Magasanikbacteria bacterium]|nr:hypothetical protein [Candidatus Magasanikbacteria bacterium]